MRRLLLINPDESVRAFYQNHSTYNKGDSGLDLFIPETVTFAPGETKLIDLKIKCEMVTKFPSMIPAHSPNIPGISGVPAVAWSWKTHTSVVADTPSPFYLYPRSSISKTPLRLANSVGIIDSGYRGSIMVALSYMHNTETILCKTMEELQTHSYTLEKGSRIVQICSPNLEPFDVSFSSSLSETERGEGGFGSTGFKTEEVKLNPVYKNPPLDDLFSDTA